MNDIVVDIDNYEDELDNIIDFGASPRATINLIKAAKARAFTEKRGYVNR